MYVFEFQPILIVEQNIKLVIDVITYFVCTFWRYGVLYDICFDVMTYFPYFSTSLCIFHGRDHRKCENHIIVDNCGNIVHMLYCDTISFKRRQTISCFEISQGQSLCPILMMALWDLGIPNNTFNKCSSYHNAWKLPHNYLHISVWLMDLGSMLIKLIWEGAYVYFTSIE